MALLLSGCRLDMHIQPKYLPYEPTDFFADGRSERQPVPEPSRAASCAWTSCSTPARKMASKPTSFLSRSRARISSAAGSATTSIARRATTIPAAADGMIVQRGFPQPPSYHIQRLREAPVGHFFGVITNGFGAMYSYADRIDPADRWRIAAYIRVLQLSQNATVERRAGKRAAKACTAARTAASQQVAQRAAGQPQ